VIHVEVQPGAACVAQTGDSLSLAIEVRVVRTRDQSVVLTDTFGGGLRGLHVRTVNNPAQYAQPYTALLKSHTEQVFHGAVGAMMKSLP
jgi:hypothetical protein